MRKLSKKQKNIIIDYVKDNYFNEDRLILQHNNIAILKIQLEKVNDYETLYSDVNRLVSDLFYIEDKEDKIQYVLNFI